MWREFKSRGRAIQARCWILIGRFWRWRKFLRVDKKPQIGLRVELSKKNHHA